MSECPKSNLVAHSGASLDKTENVKRDNVILFDEIETAQEFHVNNRDATGKDGNLTLRESNQTKTPKSKTTVDIVNGCIFMTLFSMRFPALVDTGATICCMSMKLFTTLFKDTGMVLKRVKYKVFLADGSISHVKNCVTLPFKIGKHSFTQEFALLPNLNRPVIFGTNFLKRNCALIDFTEDPTPENQPIRAIRSMTIAPLMETAVQGEVFGINDVCGTQGITNNLWRENPVSFLVGKGNVTPDERNRHPIMIWNTSTKPLKIQKGMILGLYTITSENEFDHSEEPNQEIATQTQQVQNQTIMNIESSDPESDSDEEPAYKQLTELTSLAHDVPIDISPNTAPKQVLSEKGKDRLAGILDKYTKCFVGPDGKLGLTDYYEHTIHVKPDTPPCHFLPFRTNPEQAEEFDDMCQDLVKKNILEETTKGAWANRSFRVHKSDGGKRLVTDLRYINANAVNQALISPRMDDSLEMVGNFNPKVFSKLDAASGFFQIPLAEESRKNTQHFYPIKRNINTRFYL